MHFIAEENHWKLSEALVDGPWVKIFFVKVLGILKFANISRHKLLLVPDQVRL